MIELATNMHEKSRRRTKVVMNPPSARKSIAKKRKKHVISNNSSSCWIRGFVILSLFTFFVTSITLLVVLEEASAVSSSRVESASATTITTSSMIMLCAQDEKKVMCDGKEKLLSILTSANIDVIDNSTGAPLPFWSEVPTWDQITALFGPSPRIVGLETCEDFRRSVPASRRMIGPAGLFNTGTNLASQLIDKNCHIVGREHGNGMEWQVPWGKHTPPSFRGHPIYRADGSERVTTEDILPVVSIREPFEWMHSMCHNNYVVRWPHQKRCPNLRYSNGTSVQIMTQYYHGKIKEYHQSLAHMWNDWNSQYTASNVTFPRLLLRHKDLIFWPEETTRIICQCAGGVLASDQEEHTPFAHVMESPAPKRKGQKPLNGLVQNWIKYGNAPFDIPNNLNLEDVRYASTILDAHIMGLFGFRLPSVP